MKPYLHYITPNPVMPPELEQLAVSVIGKTIDIQEARSGKKSEFFQTYNLPEPVIHWIKNNLSIPSDVEDDDYRIHIIGSTFRIHSDYGRSWGLNYIIDSGGPVSESAWYNDSKDVKLYGEIIPVRTWHLFNTEIQHTVHGIDPSKKRIGITINFKKRDMPNPINVY
jgi:hypothetical protein